MAKTFEVKLKRSTIGCSEHQIRTVHALGLRKINHSVEVEANPAIIGMVRKVNHLVAVESI